MTFIVISQYNSMLYANPEMKTFQLKRTEKQIDDDEYLFKPGDGLFISTFPDTSSFLNKTFPIDDNGCVEFPIVGRIKIISMKKSEIITFIQKNFQQWIRSQNIYIKPMCRISILGGVARPGLYYFDYHSTFWSAIRNVGGPTHETGLKKMCWERNRKEVTDNIIPYFEKGISLKNMGVKSGDQFSTPSHYETFWERFITLGMPIITFGTSIVFFYLTYQQSLYMSSILAR